MYNHNIKLKFLPASKKKTFVIIIFFCRCNPFSLVGFDLREKVGLGIMHLDKPLS